MVTSPTPPTPGLTRRDALRRSAALGGALVWTVPVVQSMSGTAVAAAPSAVGVEGVKSGRTAGGRTGAADGLLGSSLPGTGSMAGDLLAVGAGAVTVGAVLRSTRKRPDASPEDGAEPAAEA
jgi:hypothetical protein